MQQQVRLCSILTILLIGLMGCSIKDETAVQDRRTKETFPVGYYSNEMHEKRGGNAILLDGADNDGSLIEFMDHTLGKERETNQGVYTKNNTNEANNLAPLANRNISTKDPLIGQSDRNYHGHLNNSNLPTRNSYYSGYEGKFVERITTATEDVKNVQEARTITYGKNVVIAVSLKDEKLADETKRNIYQAIQPHLEGRTAYFVTNESQFNRIKSIDNDLRNGGPKGQINKDMQNLIRSINNQ